MLSGTTSFGSERGFRGSRVARWNVVRERLPFPIVHYPGHYGPFTGFQRDGEKNVHLCSCALKAVSGYIRLRLAKPIPANSHPERRFILDGLHFPLDLVRPLMDAGLKNDATVINYIWFTDGLCPQVQQGSSFAQILQPHVRRRILQDIRMVRSPEGLRVRST